MQSNINLLPGCTRVMCSEIQERIERRSRICIQERFTQPRLADFVDRQILPFVPGITKTQFPIPSLEIIAKLCHLATETDVEELVPVGELFMSGAGVVNTAKRNSGSYWETAAVRKEIGNSRIRDRERIKWILDWHADAE